LDIVKTRIVYYVNFNFGGTTTRTHITCGILCFLLTRSYYSRHTKLLSGSRILIYYKKKNCWT